MESTKTNQGLLLRLAGIWWAGVKLLLQWVAVGIVATIFLLPVVLLIYFVGEQAGRVLLGAFYVLCMPIIVCLTSRYLYLFGEGDRVVNEHQGGPSPVTESNEGKMRTKIATSVAVAFLIAVLLLSGPDPFSALSNGVIAALLCGIPLLVLARFHFMKSASPSVHTLVAALVCVLAVLLLACLLFMQRISHLQRRNVTATGLIQPTFVSATP